MSTTERSLMVSKNEIPLNGTLTVKVGAAEKYFHGPAFRISKPNSSKYYESEAGLSYYFVENNGSQKIRLGKCSNGLITYSKESYLATSIGHGGEFRIVMQDDTIYVYFANRLLIKYVDSKPLVGHYYGYRATNERAVIQGDINYSDSTTVDKADYLIFGHSYTGLWSTYKEDFKDLDGTVLNVGIGGANTYHFLNTAQEIAEYESKWGIYWNGINDINADFVPSVMANNLESTMIIIKQLNPDFQCAVIGINRCTFEKSMARLSQIAEANDLYEQVCNKYDWLHFVDVEYLYSDESGNPLDYWFIDKLHPTFEAYTKVADIVVPLIQSVENK